MLKHEDFQQINELKKNNKEVYELIKKLSDFCLETLSMGCHDLKNHAAFISSYCQLAHLKESPLTQTAEFSRIEAGTRELTNLLNQISLFRYSFCNTDFVQCSLGNVWEMTSDILDETLNDVSYNILGKSTIENSSLPLFCNPKNMAQAIYSIIVNSIEACENYEAVLSISLWEENGLVYLSVSDNGCGFPQKMLADGINPFVSEKIKHNGLGLSIAAITLYMHNGDLLLSNTDNGAKVTMVFPHI